VDASVSDAPRDAITLSDAIVAPLDTITAPLDATSVSDARAEPGAEVGPESGPLDLGANPTDDAAPDIGPSTDGPRAELAGPDLSAPADARPAPPDATADLAIDTAQPRPDAGRPDAGRDAPVSAGTKGCQCSIGATPQGGPSGFPLLGLILFALLVHRRKRQAGK
jgi:MYXO-CTERM domain-containing protein